MSWSRWTPFGGSRWSPFGGRAEEMPMGPPQTYGASYPSGRQPYTTTPHYPSSGSPPRQRTTRDDDILIFRYKGTNYPLKFPPYSIDDRRLTVGYAREKAAEKLGIDDPDLLRMIHKGKRLDDDGVFFSDIGFRSDKPTEILCTLLGTPMNGPGGADMSDGASDDDDEDDEDNRPTSATDTTTGAKKRKSKKKKKRKTKPAGASPDGPSPPYPTNTVEYLPMPSGAAPTHRAPPAPLQNNGTPTSSTGRSPAPSPRPPPTPTATPVQPLTPMGKLTAIAGVLRSDLGAQCAAYMADPPKDTVKRKFEHKRLTETLMAQVMLKLDAVETEGDADARALRKELVREAQGVLNKLDETVGETS